MSRSVRQEVLMRRLLGAPGREVEQLKELLKGAIEYDKRNNEPHCEIDEKVALIKQIAKAFGIDVTDIFKDKTI